MNKNERWHQEMLSASSKEVENEKAIKEISLGHFLNLQDDIILRNLVVWLVHNFDTCSLSLLLTYSKMRMTEEDVQMTLGIPKGPLKVIKVENETNGSVEFKSLLKHWKEQWPDCDISLSLEGGLQKKFHKIHHIHMSSRCVILIVLVFKLRSLSILGIERVDQQGNKIWDRIGIRSDLKDSLDKTTVTDEKEEVDEKKRRNRSVEAETNELLLGACTSLKRVRKFENQRVMCSSGRCLASRRIRNPVLSPDSYESEGFLIEIDVIEKQFVSS
ncbi:hypothetical protein Cgig2_000913 [Carnegiea gigantea]|uniref:Uncharacterized protein n=1 Tax=Carnegiea gigantea TaxID=171969 RepID=A0A9Q1QLN2_9CARY|nr:hypothetical protein Cgig2_000913 [Carnegiea gigantea]